MLIFPKKPGILQGHARNRRLSFLLLLIGVGGIIAICFPLTPDPMGIFETLPAAILLVPITCKIGSELQLVAENNNNQVQVVT